MPTTLPTIRRIFDRVAQNTDSIDHAKVSKYLKDIGLGGGLLGGQKVSKGADGFLAKFDTTKDGKVTWSEFVAAGKHLMPPQISDGQGRLNPQLVGTVFDQIAHGQTKATKDDVAAFVKPQLTGGAALFAGAIADASGRVASDALDADGDGSFTQDDMSALVKDINAELDKLV